MRYNARMSNNQRQDYVPGRSSKKDVPLNIRVSALEKEAFARAAEVAGVPLSGWMRERLRSCAMRELDNINELAPFLVSPGESRHGNA